MASGVSEAKEAQRQWLGVHGQCPGRDSEPDKVIFKVYNVLLCNYWTSVMKHIKKKKKKKKKNCVPGGNRKWWAAPPGAAHRSYNPVRMYCTYMYNVGYWPG